MELSGAEALVRQLAKEGVTQIFGVPGVQLDHVLDALVRLTPEISYTATRHEQGAAYMAEAYARTTPRPGVCLVVPGPGLLNAMSALATGYACSAPMLCITAQAPTAMIGRGLGMLHEVPDQDATLATVTKWSARAAGAAQIPALVHEAATQLRSGRPRPVGLTFPVDVLGARAEVELVDTDPDARYRTAPDPAALAKAAAALAAARRPVVYAGSGVLAADASPALVTLAERLGSPVVTSRNGVGSIPGEHPLAFPSFAAGRLLLDADVVLVVGSRFVSGFGRPPGTAPEAKVILLNADPADLGPPRQAAVTIQADAQAGLEALLAELGGGPGANPTRTDLDALRTWCARQIAAVEPQWSFVRALREAIPDDGILVNELTQVGYLAGVAYPVRRPRTFLTPGYQGTLGYGYAAALGVKVGNPDRAVVSINGDGGFGWNLQELATARKYGIGVVAVVFNDGGFGNVRRIQAEEFDGRFIGCDLANPDFVRLAEAFGIPGVRVQTPDALAGALKEHLAQDDPALIEVPVGEMPSVWPLLLDGASPDAARG